MQTPERRDEFRVTKGTVIFRQGDPGAEMFVVSDGKVRLTLGTEGQEKEIAVLGKGEFFGELSLLSGVARTATARAIEDSTLLPIARDVFAMMVKDDLEIVFRMMNTQGNRLRQTNQPIEELMHTLGRVRIVADCLKRVARAHNQLPLTVEIDGLVRELGLSEQDVEMTFADLAQSGAGVVRDRRWRVDTPEQVTKLTEVLCRYAGGSPG